MLEDLALQTARAHQQAGRFDDARKMYKQILARNSKHVESHAQLALMDFAQGRTQDAVKENERALKLRPDIAGLHNNQGSFLLTLGRFKDAAASFERALRLDPKDAQARNNLGGALSKMGRLDEALASIDAAIALVPTYAKAYSDRTMVLTRLGRFMDAVASGDKAVALQPNLAEAHDHRGVALLQLGRYAEAMAGFDAAIAADGGFALAHSNRGVVLDLMKRTDEARESFRQALALDPKLQLAAGPALNLRMSLCDWNGAAEDGALILARIDAGELASLPFNVLSLPSSAAQQRRVAGLYTALISPRRVPAAVPAPAPARRLRIGYFSADLGEHPVGHAIAGVFERHDRARFEISAFQIAPLKPDALHARLRAAVDHFIDVSSLSDEAAAAMARDLGLDIAVDLTGYTNHARSGIFSYGAAPVQAAWLGYPGTLANEAIPYLIADNVVIPEARRGDYAEKIVALPSCFFPPDDRRAIAPAPSRADAGLPETGFVFCSFNTAYKITPAIFEIWMRLVAAVPGSVLWLAIRNETAQRNLRAEAARRGVDPARLVFAPHAPMDQHLGRHALAGLFLDTAPFGAHSTAADALQAGLPVLTRPGETFSGRVAASLVTSLGMPELIAAGWADYETKALEIARDAKLAADVRAKLAANLKSAPTYDTARFTRALEAAYTALAARTGQPPAALTISPHEAL
ncbi:MAG: tetratricopeptide repeat protein [Rhodospirillaceae bacterium]|nr:tetratricopeptide repeat protein [Rhodospirillaceae bacterium]